MSEQEGLKATLESLVTAFETGNVTSDVTNNLKQLLPFSRFCSVAICGPDDWLAATSNLLLPGSITTSLVPKSESLAGLAAILSRQLRSFQRVADQRLFDVEQFHTLHGPGALIATPLPGADAPPARNAIGGYTSTAVGAFLVDLDVQPATPVELRMRAHLRTLAGMIAPMIEAPGRAVVEQLCAACFPAAALGGCLGAEVPPPKQPAKPRRRRGATCEDVERWPGNDETDAPACTLVAGPSLFCDDAAAAFEQPPPEGRAQYLDLQQHTSHRPNPFMDLSPISSVLLPSRAAAAASSHAGAAQSAADAQDRDSSEESGGGETLGVDTSAAISGSLTSEDTARASNGLLGRAGASPRLSSIEWPVGEESGACESLKQGPASMSTAETGSSTEQNYDSNDVVTTKMAAKTETLALRAQQHPLWLSFRDRDLERNFAAWHSLQLQKLDRAAISFAAFIFAYLGVVPPHSLAAHAPLAYSVTAAIMLFLLGFAWIAHPCRYLARRTLLLKSFVLLYTVFNSQIGFPGVLDAMAGGDGPCTIPFILRYINAQPLLTSCVVTMARLSVQAPIQAFQLAISLGLPSKVCGACYASRSHAACLVNLHTQQLLVGLLAPLAIVYIAERRFRATFLSIQIKKLS